MKMRRRLELLEKRLIGKPIILLMRDGRTVRLPCHGDYLLNLVMAAGKGQRTPELDLIVESVSSIEPGGGHMLDMVRIFYGGPGQSDETTEADSQRPSVN